MLPEPYGDVGYVRDPKLVGSLGDEIPDKVGVQRKAVRRVRGPGLAPLAADLEAVTVDDVPELVAPDPVGFRHVAPVHLPQFPAAGAASLGTHPAYVFQGEGFPRSPAGCS